MVVTRVFLVDDHRAGLELLCDALERDPRLTVVGTATSFACACTALPGSCPDVAVVDDALPDADGLQLCRFVHDELDGVASILYAVADRPGLRDRAISAGASAVLLKEIDTSELVATILALDHGAVQP